MQLQTVQIKQINIVFQYSIVFYNLAIIFEFIHISLTMRY